MASRTTRVTKESQQPSVVPDEQDNPDLSGLDEEDYDADKYPQDSSPEPDKDLSQYEKWSIRKVPQGDGTVRFHAHHEDNVHVVIADDEGDLRKHMDSVDETGNYYTEDK